MGQWEHQEAHRNIKPLLKYGLGDQGTLTLWKKKRQSDQDQKLLPKTPKHTSVYLGSTDDKQVSEQAWNI